MTDKRDLSGKIAGMVPGCGDVAVIQPVEIGQGPWQNELLLFIKPEAFLVEKSGQTERIIELVLDKLDDFAAKVSGIAIVGGNVLDRAEIMSRHYGLINLLSRSASTYINDEDKRKIADALGVSLDDYAILGGHEYLARYPNETGADLDRLWFAGRSTKIRSGFYVRAVRKDDRDLLLVNAFHPEQLHHFTDQSHRIVLFLLHSDTSWSALRNQMVGATFPDKAAPESIRGTLYADPGRYGFESVGIANNVVHLSAGPFEGMFEIVNFFGKIVDLDVDRQPPLVLRRMLDQGIDRRAALKALDNPAIAGAPKPTDLFTATEDMDTGEAIAFWKQHFGG